MTIFLALYAIYTVIATCLFLFEWADHNNADLGGKSWPQILFRSIFWGPIVFFINLMRWIDSKL